MVDAFCGLELGELAVRIVKADNKAEGSDDAMLEAAIECGANECVSSEDSHEFIASLEDFATVRDGLEARLGEPALARVEWRSKTMTTVSDDAGETLIKLLDVLDEHDDLQNVYGNYEFSAALMRKLEA